MKKFKLGKNKALLLTDEAQRMYFTGFKSSFGYVFVSDSEIAVFTDKRYLFACKKAIESQFVKVFEFNGLDGLKQYLDNNAIKTLYLDYTLETVSNFKQYKSFGVKLKDASEKIEKAFSIKSAFEIKNIKKACDIAEKAFYNILPFVKKGITEKQLANELEYEMLKLGAEKTSFDTIVAFGQNTAVPHHETGETVLEENTPILIDFGCKVNGYCSDCTRTFYYGQPSKEFERAYEAVLEANLLSEDNIKAGFDTKQADAVARDCLKKYGYAEAFTHSLGHGIGINVHEFPYLSPKRAGDILKNGMVFSIEPGVYYDGKFGIRIEDTVYLSGGKVKRLFKDDKKLIKINI